MSAALTSRPPEPWASLSGWPAWSWLSCTRSGTSGSAATTGTTRPSVGRVARLRRPSDRPVSASPTTGADWRVLRERPRQRGQVHSDDQQRDQAEVDRRDQRAIERLHAVVRLLLLAARAPQLPALIRLVPGEQQ